MSQKFFEKKYKCGVACGGNEIFNKMLEDNPQLQKDIAVYFKEKEKEKTSLKLNK